MTAAPPARILVVEDDYLVGVELEAGLGEAGYQVVGIANSAEEAAVMAAAERPALMIMDIRLNGARDGIDAALEIYGALGIRAIFASAHHEPEIRARAQPARPLGWLAKPYPMDALLALIERGLEDLAKG